VEPFVPKPLLVLVGHGPVLETLAALGRATDFDVMPLPSDPAHEDLGRLSLGPSASVVVGTHGSGDEEVLEQILSGGAGYVSLIASRKRAAAITRTLAQRGVVDDQIRRLKAPAGHHLLLLSRLQGSVRPRATAVRGVAGVIAGILLAAGLSRRMGRAKLLLPLDGRPVVRHAAEGLLAAGVEPLSAVVGPDGEAVAAALADLRVQIVVNPHPEAGQASSLVAGIAALPPGTEAVVVALGDQPFVPADVIRELIYALRGSDKVIAAPRYRDGLGNPVLFRAAVFPELLALGGDRGARAVVERDEARVALVEVDRSMPEDVDTPDDYARLRSREEPV
jgi:molybdenum cofactor cytidylyltransferase